MKYNMSLHLIFEDGIEKYVTQAGYSAVKFNTYNRKNRHTTWEKGFNPRDSFWETSTPWDYGSSITELLGEARRSASMNTQTITREEAQLIYPSAFRAPSEWSIQVNQATRTISTLPPQPVAPRGVVAAAALTQRQFHDNEYERRQVQREADLRKRDEEKRNPAKFWERAKKFF